MTTQVQVQGFTTANILEVEATTRALRATLRDLDWGALGIYSHAAPNGATQMSAALAGNSPIFSFRNSHATNLFLVRRVQLSAAVSATGFTAGAAQFNMYAARSFTANDTGGTAVVPSGNQNKLRATMGTTSVADIRISATATLTAGTRTLDANPIGSVIGGAGSAGSAMIPPNSFLFDARPGEHPLLLAQNEGFVIQAVVPATGTWFFAVKTEWAEVTTY